MCSTFLCNLTVQFTFNCLIQSNVEVTVKKTVNQLYNYSIVLGAAIKCKPYSEITVKIGTQRKTVKITTNIFAVYFTLYFYYNEPSKYKHLLILLSSLDRYSQEPKLEIYFEKYS